MPDSWAEQTETLSPTKAKKITISFRNLNCQRKAPRCYQRVERGPARGTQKRRPSKAALHLFYNVCHPRTRTTLKSQLVTPEGEHLWFSCRILHEFQWLDLILQLIQRNILKPPAPVLQTHTGWEKAFSEGRGSFFNLFWSTHPLKFPKQTPPLNLSKTLLPSLLPIKKIPFSGAFRESTNHSNLVYSHRLRPTFHPKMLIQHFSGDWLYFLSVPKEA